MSGDAERRIPAPENGHAEKTTFDGTKLPMVEKASQNHYLLYDNPNRCQTKMPKLNTNSQVS